MAVVAFSLPRHLTPPAFVSVARWDGAREHASYFHMTARRSFVRAKGDM
jgi:hypothetical protein